MAKYEFTIQPAIRAESNMVRTFDTALLTIQCASLYQSCHL